MQKVTYVIAKTTTDTTTTETTEVTTTSDKVVRISLKVIVKNLTGTFNVTDLMLQTGDKSAIWNGHPSEVRWLFNE